MSGFTLLSMHISVYINMHLYECTFQKYLCLPLITILLWTLLSFSEAPPTVPLHLITAGTKIQRVISYVRYSLKKRVLCP